MGGNRRFTRRASKVRATRHYRSRLGRRLDIEPLEERRMLSVGGLTGRPNEYDMDALVASNSYSVEVSEGGEHLYLGGRRHDALGVFRFDELAQKWQLEQAFYDPEIGPSLSAVVTELPNEFVAYDIFFEANADDRSAVAIDLKFSGNIIQQSSAMLGGMSIADSRMADLAQSIDPAYNPLLDSWFAFGPGTSWVDDLPTTHADHPEGFAGLGIAEVDGAMFMSAGSGPGSNVTTARVAHIVVGPTSEDPLATLSVSALLARSGMSYSVEADLTVNTRSEDALTAVEYSGAYDSITTHVDGIEGIRSIDLSPDGRYLYAAAEDDEALVVFRRDEINGELAVHAIFRNGDTMPDGTLLSGMKGANDVHVSDDGSEIYVTGDAPDVAALFHRDSVTGAHEYVGVAEWQPPLEEPSADEPDGGAHDADLPIEDESSADEPTGDASGQDESVAEPPTGDEPAVDPPVSGHDDPVIEEPAPTEPPSENFPPDATDGEYSGDGSETTQTPADNDTNDQEAATPQQDTTEDADEIVPIDDLIMIQPWPIVPPLGYPISEFQLVVATDEFDRVVLDTNHILITHVTADVDSAVSRTLTATPTLSTASFIGNVDIVASSTAVASRLRDSDGVTPPTSHRLAEDDDSGPVPFQSGISLSAGLGANLGSVATQLPAESRRDQAGAAARVEPRAPVDRAARSRSPREERSTAPRGSVGEQLISKLRTVSRQPSEALDSIWDRALAELLGDDGKVHTDLRFDT